MTKNKKFKKGQLVQHIDDGRLFIFVKYAAPKRAHLVELDNYGDPVGIILTEHRYLETPKKYPDTFKIVLIN
jgi:hypothetical protein